MVKYPIMFNFAVEWCTVDLISVIVSNEGQYPFPSEEDHASFLGIGPMCRYATDLVPILKVIAAKNAHKLDLDSKVGLHPFCQSLVWTRAENSTL